MRGCRPALHLAGPRLLSAEVFVRMRSNRGVHRKTGESIVIILAPSTLQPGEPAGSLWPVEPWDIRDQGARKLRRFSKYPTSQQPYARCAEAEFQRGCRARRHVVPGYGPRR